MRMTFTVPLDVPIATGHCTLQMYIYRYYIKLDVQGMRKACIHLYIHMYTARLIYMII